MEIVLPDNDRLCWNDYFMGLAIMASMRSPDPHTKVGAVLVNQKNKIISTGYNGLPKKISSTNINWARVGNELDTKYPFVLHAEDNAIQNANENLENATLFVSLYPCNDCAKKIIQKGITRVWYLKNPYKDTWQVKAAEMMFNWADLKVEKFEAKKDIITINLKE